MISIVVFGFYNFRKKARCFSGDVGSVSMAFIILFIMTTFIVKTGDWSYVLFLLVYGLDTFWTFVQRAINKEKLMDAHRKHLYQLFCNEMGFAHLSVAIGYAMIQLGVNYLVYLNQQVFFVSPFIFIPVLMVVFSLIYIGIKVAVYKRMKAL